MNGFFVFSLIFENILFSMKNFKITNFIIISLLILFSGCGTVYKLQKEIKKENKTSNSFKGFVLYDPEMKKELINTNGSKYFTPASNVKLFTFYTAHKKLGDSIVGLNYYHTKDSLIIQGTADPTFLNGYDNSKVLDFLKQSKDTIYLIDKTIDDKKYGNGWSWDDYQYYYMSEKSLFPIKGNIFKYSITTDSIETNSSFLEENLKLVSSLERRREVDSNQFFALLSKEKTYETPFVTSNQLTAKLLENELDKPVRLVQNKDYNFEKIYSESLDSIYKKLLVDSNNFIAEQLMLIVGNEVSGKYNVKEAINYSLKNHLNNLPQSPRWVDGSGLSRYNLFSPSDMVYLLDKILNEIPKEKLLNYFPIAGETGTLKNYKKSNTPFIYAKSGSLSNNYCLSGYITTKKGKTLIFSYMHNHFKKSTSSIKEELYKKLKMIYENY